MISRRRIGVNFCEGRADIRLWAPEASSVALKNLSGNKLIGLNKQEFGFWGATTGAISPGDRYKFLLNGQDEFPDPASLSQPEGVHGASEAMDLNEFRWNDKSWKNIPLQKYILYELHTGTFTPEGNSFR